MRRQDNPWRLLAITFGLALGSAIDIAQAPTPIGHNSHVSLIQDFFKNAFPELAGKGLEVTVSLDINLEAAEWTASRVISVSIRRHTDTVDSSSQDETRFLGAFCQLAGTQPYLGTVILSGVYVHTRELRRLTETLRAHPDWSDSDLQAALVRAGAKYGPKNREAFVHDVDIRRFGTVLGTIRRSEAKFDWHMGVAPGTAADIRQPGWTVSVETDHASNQRLCYRLWFEPIDGRLVMLDRSPCNNK
jgi:hypothetical protein